MNVTVHHVLKDGTRIDDIEGHVIKAADFQALYEVISRINQKEGEEKADAAV